MNLWKSFNNKLFSDIFGNMYSVKIIKYFFQMIFFIVCVIKIFFDLGQSDRVIIKLYNIV